MKKFSAIPILIVFISITPIPQALAAQNSEEGLTKLLAVQNLQEGKAIISSRLASFPPSAIDTLKGEAHGALIRRDYERAALCYELAIEVAERTGKNDLLPSLVYESAYPYPLLKRPKEAEQKYLKSIILSEAQGKTDYIPLALNMLAILAGDASNYAAAKEYATRSLQLIEAKAITKESLAKTTRASVLATLGSVKAWEGNYSAALADLNESLSVYESLGISIQSNNFMVVDRIIDIGHILYLQGFYTEALTKFNQALSKARAGRLPNQVAQALNAIGILYLDQGDYLSADAALKEGLKISRVEKDAYSVLTISLNIGVSSQRQGRFDEALSYFNEAHQLAAELNAQDFLPTIWEGRGACFRGKKSYAQALEAFDLGIALADHLGNKLRKAEMLWLKSEVLGDTGQLSQSIAYADQAYDIAREIQTPLLRYLSLTARGKSLLADKKFVAASSSLTLAINDVESLRNQVAGQDYQRAYFFRNKVEPYHLMVQAQVTLNNPQAALSFAERAKGRALLDVLQSNQDTLSTSLSQTDKNRDQQLKDAVTILNAQLYRETQKGSPDQKVVADLNFKLIKARLDYDTFLNAVYASYPRLRLKQGSLHPLAIEDLHKLLPDAQTTLVEFVVLEEVSYLFLISRGEAKASDVDIKVFPIEMRKAALQEQVERFRARLESRSLAVRSTGELLFNTLFGKAKEALADKKLLIILPDSILWDLPFQALVQPSGRYLIEDHALFCAPSLTVLQEMLKKDTHSANRSLAEPKRLLAFGNPLVGGETKARVSSVSRDEKLAPLPAAEAEVQSLAKLYPDSSKILIGKVAREDTAKSLMSDYQVIHFATHGILNNQNPLYSQIVLAQSEESPTDDGLLEAHEIMRLRLNAAIVVLSACETARGGINDGEGVIGLSWAFFVAGCPTTVVSQWKVESNSTSQLMVEFHRAIKLNPSISKAEALRQAALTLMKNKQYSHPFFWAPFVVIGNGY
jgi:CHAT domain-containing protein/Tfp pilus assembly protein PilF